MKKLLSLVVAILLLVATFASAQKTVYVKPYTKKDGTQVQGHYRRPPQKRGTTTSDPHPVSTESGVAQSTGDVSGPASELVGITEDELDDALGTPSLTSNGVRNYDSRNGTLRVTVKDHVVTAVRPGDFDLAMLASAPVEVVPNAPSEPPPAPHDAVARCGDGLYVYVSTGEKTCSGHGGVAAWLKK